MIDPIVSEQLSTITNILKMMKDKIEDLEYRVSVLESKDKLTDCVSNINMYQQEK